VIYRVRGVEEFSDQMRLQVLGLCYVNEQDVDGTFAPSRLQEVARYWTHKFRILLCLLLENVEIVVANTRRSEVFCYLLGDVGIKCLK
jgi:hypothetical protein